MGRANVYSYKRPRCIGAVRSRTHMQLIHSMSTVSIAKLFSLVLVNEIQVRAISDYKMLSIYFD